MSENEPASRSDYASAIPGRDYASAIPIPRVPEHFHCARCSSVVMGTPAQNYDPNKPGIKGWCARCTGSINP